MKVTKKLFLPLIVLTALSFVACSNDDDDDDNTSEAALAAPAVSTPENDYTTITVTVPANVNQVRLYRKASSSSGNFTLMYQRTFSDASTSKGTYEIKDYFANEGTEYTYYYQVRTVSGNTSTWSEISEEVTATAHKGNGALASGLPSVSYDSGTSVLTFSTLPTLTENIPAGFDAPHVRAFIAEANTHVSPSHFTVTQGTTRNVADYLMRYVDENWFGIKLECAIHGRCKSISGNENYYSDTWTATVTGSADKTFTVTAPRIDEATLSSGVPSFPLTIPAGARSEYIARKEISDTSFSTVLLVQPASGNTFAAETSYTFTDPYVEAGKTYSYRYYSYDGSANSAYSYTKNVTATSGSGVLSVTLSGTGEINYNANTGVVTFMSVPTVTLTPASAANTLSTPVVTFRVQSSTGRTVSVCEATVGGSGNVYNRFTSGSNAAYASEFLGQSVTPLWVTSGVGKQGDNARETWYPVGTTQFTGSAYGLPDSIPIPASVAE